MSGNITVKILSDEDFDGLGYESTRGADISGSLGFADKMNNRVFVRDTGVDQLNKYLVNHELEHLYEAEGTDEDANVPGIRHKFWLLPLLALAGASAATAQAGSSAKSAGKAQGELEQQTRLGQEAAMAQPQIQSLQPQAQQEQPRMAELAKSAIDISQPGAATSPLNLFGSGQTQASERVSQPVTGLGSLGGGLRQQDLERLKGQYAGRLTF